jgi:hypothetical protein
MRQCRNKGAGGLTWREFTAKMKSRSARRPVPCNREKPVDVDDWIDYFGLDKTKI